MKVVTAEEVERLLPIKECIPIVRDAMIRFSADQNPQPLRSVVEVGIARAFGVMPGRLSGTCFFGAKLVSVFPTADGRQRHQGIVILFDGEDGAPLRIADAEAITSIRTAAATAVATEALARVDARNLSIFGCGQQAAAHLAALTSVRSYDGIVAWGRSAERVERFAEAQSERLGLDVQATTDAEHAAHAGDVLCTVTGARDPILHGRWVRPGTHVNLVGSSVPGPREGDSELIALARFYVDSRRSAEVAAAEYMTALAEGAIGASHIAGEIGEVLAGTKPGRTAPGEVTVYKSLGLVVQDLAAAQRIHEALLDEEVAGARHRP